MSAVCPVPVGTEPILVDPLSPLANGLQDILPQWRTGFDLLPWREDGLWAMASSGISPMPGLFHEVIFNIKSLAATLEVSSQVLMVLQILQV